jgi:hypothetical protein
MVQGEMDHTLWLGCTMQLQGFLSALCVVIVLRNLAEQFGKNILERSS